MIKIWDRVSILEHNHKGEHGTVAWIQGVGKPYIVQLDNGQGCHPFTETDLAVLVPEAQQIYNLQAQVKNLEGMHSTSQQKVTELLAQNTKLEKELDEALGFAIKRQETIKAFRAPLSYMCLSHPAAATSNAHRCTQCGEPCFAFQASQLLTLMAALTKARQTWFDAGKKAVAEADGEPSSEPDPHVQQWIECFDLRPMNAAVDTASATDDAAYVGSVRAMARVLRHLLGAK